MGRSLAFLLLAGIAAVGCSNETPASNAATGTSTSAGSGGGGGGCEPGDKPLADGTCEAPGLAPGPCPVGQFAVDGGACEPAGIPSGAIAGVAPSACAQGFTSDGLGGCIPTLPDTCPAGTIAIPGDSACRDVAPCDAGTWGSIPTDATTQFVDPSFVGASDGTAANPWTSISSAIAAATNGAVIALAQGAYPSFLLDKPVRIWGRCPSVVSISGPITIATPGAPGTEIRDVAVTSEGIFINDAADLLLYRVWVHDTADAALWLNDFQTTTTIEGSLIEGAADAGVLAYGGSITIDSSVVRGTQPGAGLAFGEGIAVQPAGTGGATLHVLRSVIDGNRSAGIDVVGSTASIEASVIRDTQPQASDSSGGIGVVAATDAMHVLPSDLAIKASVVSRNLQSGLYVVGSTATIEDTVVRDTDIAPIGGSIGIGILVAAEDVMPGGPSTVTIRGSLVSDSRVAGIQVIESDATIANALVRGSKTNPANDSGAAGIWLDMSPGAARAATAAMDEVLVEQNESFGILVQGGSKATIQRSTVRDTTPEPSTLLRGRGIAAAVGANGARAQVTLSRPSSIRIMRPASSALARMSRSTDASSATRAARPAAASAVWVSRSGTMRTRASGRASRFEVRLPRPTLAMREPPTSACGRRPRALARASARDRWRRPRRASRAARRARACACARHSRRAQERRPREGAGHRAMARRADGAG